MTPETLDSWRIIPRILVTLYGFMCWYVAMWFMGLEAPTGEQTTFATAIWAAAAAWFGFYVNSGQKRE